MSIQSIQEVTRDWAIERITDINNFIADHDYLTIESWSFETDYDIQEYVDNFDVLDLIHIQKWTSKMLEKWLDEPYFRKSLFDNYHVVLKVE